MNIRQQLAAAAGVLALAGGTLAAQTIQINGAGATFPYPIYSKWFSEYNKVQPERPDQLPVAGFRGGHQAAHAAARSSSARPTLR